MGDFLQEFVWRGEHRNMDIDGGNVYDTIGHANMKPSKIRTQTSKLGHGEQRFSHCKNVPLPVYLKECPKAKDTTNSEGALGLWQFYPRVYHIQRLDVGLPLTKCFWQWAKFQNQLSNNITLFWYSGKAKNISSVRKKFPIMVLMFPYNFTSFALEVTKIVKLPFQSSLDSSITSIVRNNNFEGCYNKIVVLWPYDIFLFYFSYFLFCLQWQCSRRSFSRCRSYTSFSVCTVSVEEQEFILKWKQFSKNLSTHVHLKAKTILQESKYTCLS